MHLVDDIVSEFFRAKTLLKNGGLHGPQLGLSLRPIYAGLESRKNL